MRHPQRVFIMSNVVLTLLMVGVIVYMDYRSRLSYPLDNLSQTYLFNLPVLIFLIILWYQYAHEKYRIESTTSFFASFIVPGFSSFIFAQIAIVHPLMQKYYGDDTNLRTMIGMIFVTNMLQILILGTIYLYLRGAHMRVWLILTERERVRSQFQQLKNQMNPHFLFNALNVAASLPYEDPERASQFIKQLGAGYRYLLQMSDMQKVELSKELDFVRAYIYIEEIRFEKKLQVDIDISESLMDCQVIPGSVQLLVQNAIKHNVNTEESPLLVTVQGDAGGITVTNNLQPRPTEEEPGRGLRNLRLQYDLFHKKFTITQTDTHFAVHIPFL